MKNFYLLRSYQVMHHSALVSVATAALLAGCASTPPPTEQMAISRAAVSNANSAGGNEYAPLQYESAIQKMGAAERAMADKNYVRARQLAEEAHADAKLAEAMARSAKAQKAADALQDDIRILRQEIDRQSN